MLSLVNSNVLCVSIVLIDDIMLVDPTKEEETICRARVTCVLVFDDRDAEADKKAIVQPRLLSYFQVRKIYNSCRGSDRSFILFASCVFFNFLHQSSTSTCR
jgi:hypothetical protein